ncbi:hypothetical protein [Sphingomonas sp. ABOLH]|uniref:hypothetical protein n=1 Tax=Sphingomonas sp. ABOLH TaxID=1985881 RepID=UPI000F7EB4C5|nr:hypothetical protein [Sphingomonas sp. ABOLH]RSV32174.1 hypothetical protein CA237_03655 [Sphingomonas sp. ABOLH]
MRVGVTGHQKRAGIDWDWTRIAIGDELAALTPPIEGWSALAVGADQLFARIVLEQGGAIVTVVPGEWYEQCFEGVGLAAYRELLAAGRNVTLDNPRGEDAFLAAGIAVADASDLLVAVWDGEGAHGRGGTADVVEHALHRGTPVLHIDPIRREVRRLSAEDARS